VNTETKREPNVAVRFIVVLLNGMSECLHDTPTTVGEKDLRLSVQVTSEAADRRLWIVGPRFL